MKINVIIGNPPYQEMSGASNSKAIYNLFIDRADEIENEQTVMIIPSRWMSDIPNGISKQWLLKMRTREDIDVLVDYKNSLDIFRNVNIAGGISYFRIKRGYKGYTNIEYHDNNNIIKRTGKLSYDNIIIRDKRIIDIIDKVKLKEGTEYISFSTIIGSSRQLSPTDNYFQSNWKGYVNKINEKNYIRYYANDRVLNNEEAYISEEDLAPDTLWLIKEYKSILPLTGPVDGRVISVPIVVGSDTCCSRTYAPMYGKEIDNREKADNMVKYCKTKFLRVIVSGIKTTQHVSKDVYKYVPIQDFTNESDINWNETIENIDKQLYIKYGLNEEDIRYIEDTIQKI